jgi:O-antigen ligase
MNKQISTFFLEKIPFLIVFCFPLIIILRSAAINVAVTLVTILILFNIFKKKQIEILKNRLVIFIIIFLFFIFINSIVNFISFEILLKSLGNFRYLFLSLAVCIVFEKISEKQRKFFIYFNLIIILLVAIDIFYQFIFYKDIFGFAPGMCDNSLPVKCLRFSGAFGNELIAGSYLSQIGFLILILFLNLDLNKINFNYLMRFFVFFLLLLTILLTGERAALLIFVTSFFFIYFFKKKIINFFFLLLFFLLLIFFSSQKIDSINKRFINLFDSWGSTSKQMTIANKIIESPWSFHYQAAIELFIQKPLIGYGPKSFRIKCENTSIDKKTKENIDQYKSFRACSTHPHNYLLEFLSENGIIGGLFFVGLFFLIFAIIHIMRKNHENENILIIIGIGSLILAIIFPFKPSGSFFSTFNASMLFYIFGFFLHYLKK